MKYIKMPLAKHNITEGTLLIDFTSNEFAFVP